VTRVLIATDAWHPQVNGVVKTLSQLQIELRRMGVTAVFLTPQHFQCMPFPGYRELKIALPSQSTVARAIGETAPDFIHIATEGPIGWSVRRFCMQNGRKFTTSYHTKFPEYANRIFGLPESWIYSLERRFHSASAGVMVSTASLEVELGQRGFQRLMRWSRGVDTELFRPSPEPRAVRPRPTFLYVGRISREKNIEAFLDAPLPGDKIVVGDGPQLAALRRRYSEVVFTGKKIGADLAALYASADVFVFPSRTDTFGLVLLEALAAGLPIVAYPVTGPVDIVEHGVSGILGEDLADSAVKALLLNRDDARARAQIYTWVRSATQFLDNVTAANSTISFGREKTFPVLSATQRLPLIQSDRHGF
jgi:glycosyltransferase involved in cell wall biosynthesis